MRYTRLGKAMRATAANPDLARNCGIRTDRVVTITWLVTGALCGLAGAVFAMNPAVRRDQHGPLPRPDPRRGVPRRPGRALRRDARRARDRSRHGDQRPFIVSDYKDVVAFVVLLAMLSGAPHGLLGARA